MSNFLKLSYFTGQQAALIKVGLERLPEIGDDERKMLEDPAMPQGLRQQELDSYLHRALTTPLSPKEEFMESGKLKGTLGGGALGAGIGALTGGGIGALSKRPGLGAAIGSAGLGTMGALVGRPLGADAGRREHEKQTSKQEELGDLYTDPYKMQSELHRYLQEGQARQQSDE